MVEDTHAGTNGSSATRSPLVAYLERLHASYVGSTRARSPRTSPSSPMPIPTGSASPRHRRRRGLRGRATRTQPFTIQSISKPFTYGLALEDARRRARSAGTIGVEPTGEAFNAITPRPARRARRCNPMVNAGAIAAIGARRRAATAERRSPASSTPTRAFAGRPLELDQARLRLRGRRPATATAPSPTCCVRVGVHRRRARRRASTSTSASARCAVDCPRPGGDGRDAGQRRAQPDDRRAGASTARRVRQRAERDDHVRHVRRRRRVAVHGRAAGQERRLRRDHRRAAGPARDRRLLAAARRARQQRPRRARVPAIASDFDLHLVRAGQHEVSPLRATYTLAQVGSKRIRSAAQRAALDVAGATTRVIEVQGELELSAVEQIAGVALDRAPGATCCSTSRA